MQQLSYKHEELFVFVIKYIILPLPALAVDGDKFSDELTHLVEEAKRPRSETASIDPVPEMTFSSIQNYPQPNFEQ